MPELPEVETIRFDLDQNLSHFKIIDFNYNTPKMIKPSPEELKDRILGSSIDSFQRRAKLIFIQLSNGLFLLIHLKMTGRLLIRDKNYPEDRWTRFFFLLRGENGETKELRFADQRKFGYLKLASRKDLNQMLRSFGPEPLNGLTLEKFEQIIRSRHKNIKSLLLEQSLISGIGNIYANDALYLSQIHPLRESSFLSENEIKSLFLSLETVLKAGLKYRGASDNSYLDAFGEKGKYQEHFLVYGKKGKICQRCKSTHIVREKIGGRGTFYCPQCQVLK